MRKTESVLLIPRVFSYLDLQAFAHQVDWTQNTIKIFGKEHLEPRLTAWFGPAYKYSSIQWNEKPMPDFLAKLTREVEEYANYEFNAALLNFYRDGQDSMGWHSDDEPEIDQTCIASLSIGASRKFKLRNKTNHDEQREFVLEHGSLLLMNDYQKDWQHAVPKTKKVNEPRINITFRNVMPA